MKSWRWVVLLGLMAVDGSVASLVVPEWADDAGATSVSYSFPTADNPFVADTETNAFGSVSSDLSLGGINALGWQDPNDPFGLTRMDGTGTWSIDTDGYMSFDIPFADGSMSLYTVDIFVDVIAYEGITLLPEISVSGTEISSATDTFLEEPDTQFPGANWMHQTWTGTVSFASSSTVSVDVTGLNGGAVIDRVAIYTNVVPEPAAISLILMAGGALLFVKRRYS